MKPFLIEKYDGIYQITLYDHWHLNSFSAEFVEEVKKATIGAKKIHFFLETPLHWNTALMVFLKEVIEFSQVHSIPCDLSNLPKEIRIFLEKLTGKIFLRNPEVDEKSLEKFKNLFGFEKLLRGAYFIKECLMRVFCLPSQRSSFGYDDFFLLLQKTGFEALGIVSLLNFLVGAIIAFVGSLQLEKVGANIFVADLVGIAMVREMGAMMTAIILTGRSGASFAASLGTMKVNEEIDALKVLGVNLIDYLVLPRFFSLLIVMPLLCIYANLMGILGGAAVGLWVLNLSFYEYMMEVKQAISLSSFSVGLIKSVAFGALISLLGCWRGLECERDAISVGQETTRSVVYAIAALVVTDALFTVLFNALRV